MSDDLTRNELWLIGSAAQLRRQWSGRCISCAHWTPHERGNHGTCAAMGAGKTDPLVDIGRSDPATQAAFGCVLWGEIDDEDAVLARTERAIAVHLLAAMPEDFVPHVTMREDLETHARRDAEKAGRAPFVEVPEVA